MDGIGRHQSFQYKLIKSIIKSTINIPSNLLNLSKLAEKHN